MIVVLLEDLDTVHSGSGSNLDRSDNFFVLFFVCFMVDYDLLPIVLGPPGLKKSLKKKRKKIKSPKGAHQLRIYNIETTI